ncbi:unnamed protein product [Candidula unifasciata]|uniref:RRM domain-containing protein n=1 Tax=Candidula unifasciata TaxID=100452 RepID=A0A8S3YPI0_9EUPU|nr:unnamed protein product [Candidula unifasciata]
MASVFVGDLPSDVTEADLYTQFSQLGTVSSVKLCRDKESGKSLGYGYVMYQELDQAEKAVEVFNSEQTHRRNMRVVMVGQVSLCQALQGNVFIKNLDRSVDSNMLYRAFSAFGNIITCKVPHGKKGSKCHGFVQFESEAAARAAISSMNGTLFYGKKLYVGHCFNRVKRESTSETVSMTGCSSSSLRTVYIKNLSPTVDSVFLKITCSPYGEVANVKIIRDADGSSKGFAFVTFKKVEEAAKAIEMLNGKEVDGRVLFAGAAMKKAGRKQQQHHFQQQQHEITLDESIIVEQQQQQQQQQQETCKKHQQSQRFKDLHLLQQPGEITSVQVLPAMIIKHHQQPQQHITQLHSSSSSSSSRDGSNRSPRHPRAQFSFLVLTTATDLSSASCFSCLK